MKPKYGQLQIAHQPSVVRDIWRTRHDEPDTCEPWLLSSDYEYDPCQLFEDREYVKKLMDLAELTHREASVIHLYFFDGHTLDSVAERIGHPTRERVRQIKTNALQKLWLVARRMNNARLHRSL